MQRLTSIHPSDKTQFPNGSGKISVPSSNPGTKIVMYNETPLNVDLDFLNGSSDVLHAWEANYWTLDGNVDEIDWSIDADSLSVTNPPINAIFLTLYQSTETLRDKTYPMALVRQLGGQQANVNGLSNEGNAINTEVIDIGTTGNARAIDIFNDHFIWSVIQAGVLHQVLKGQTAGNPLQLGQAGDITEVLGKLLIDQVPSATATPPTGTGTVTIYEMTFGSLKIAAVIQTNFQNTSASKFTLALPTAFTNWALILSGRSTQTELLAGGVAQSLNVVTALAAGANGTQSAQTVIFQYNIAEMIGAFDTLRFQASNGTVHTNDGLFMIGV